MQQLSPPRAARTDAPHASTQVEPKPLNDAGAELMPLWHRVVNLIVILLPIVGLIAAMAYAWGWGVGWVEVSLLLGMYILTGLGVTVGFHRFFAHKSFDTGPVVKAVLGVLGSMSVQGSIIHWSAAHRCHHQHSDEEDDPHSPHMHGTGFFNMVRGFYRSHVGWLFEKAPKLDRYVPDLARDKMVRVISMLFPLWVVLSMLIPTVIGGLVTMSWWGAFLGFIWGGLVRVLVVHHITWSINSVCHIWGTRPFRSHDHSRNNLVFGVLGFGEGWHNNHHAFPTSARHGLRWWEVDTSFLVIWAMSKVGLAWNVRTPAPDRLLAKRRRD